MSKCALGGAHILCTKLNYESIQWKAFSLFNCYIKADFSPVPLLVTILGAALKKKIVPCNFVGSLWYEIKVLEFYEV